MRTWLFETPGGGPRANPRNIIALHYEYFHTSNSVRYVWVTK